MAVPRQAKLRRWLHDVAAETSEVVLRHAGSSRARRQLRIGADGTPTSYLDELAEKVIVRRLKDAPIPLNLLSEEIGTIDAESPWWLIADPVDGTRNAGRGLPFYAVSLAIGQKDFRGIEMGIVQNVPSGEVYYGEKGGGATLDRRRIKPRRMDKGEILLGAALDYEREVLRLPGRGHLHFRDLGSAALEVCLVAQGALDGFLCSTPYLRIYDVAAGAIILEEAGGHMLDLHKKPLNAPYDVKNRIALVAVGDMRVWEAVR